MSTEDLKGRAGNDTVLATSGEDIPGMRWIKDLVAIDTVSRQPNIGLIETVRDYLRGFGIEATLTRGARDQWANLFATIPSFTGAVRGGIVLSGHTDVVPVDGQAWTSDPFAAKIREGKLYGRGTCDMKGFIGSVLAVVPDILRAELLQPMHLALSFDEEIGCLGAPLLIADMKARGIEPDACIVGEPTSMRPVVGHKGVNLYRCSVHGRAAHSSLTPSGLNAIEYAARLICHIREAAEAFKKQGPFDEYYDVPYSTAQTSTIQGGNSINTVPAECSFEFEFRNLPILDPSEIFRGIERYAQDTLLPEMRTQSDAAAITFTKISSAPGLDAAEEAAITQLVRALTQDKVKKKVTYGTEAGLFALAGVPSIVCGPGDIQQAHRADEYVSLDQLRLCDGFLRKLITACAANGSQGA